MQLSRIHRIRPGNGNERMLRVLLIVMLVGDAHFQENVRSSEVCPSSPECFCCLVSSPCPCGGQCQDGYFGGKCLNRCPANCLRCRDPDNPTDDHSLFGVANCTECIDGYYSTTEYFQCQFTCPDICQTCRSATECTSCKAGYVMYNGQCTECKTGCASCTSYNDCSVCEDGYYNSGGWTGNLNCVECSTGCSNQCDKANGACICKVGYTGSRCDSCDSGYYKNGNICSQCQSSCVTCTSYEDCSVCQDGSYNSGGWTGNLNCVECSTGCANQCDKTTGACTCKVGYTGSRCESCESGYYNNGEICFLCLSSCVTCTSSSTCDVCVTGYFLNGNNQCQQCNYGCDICTSVSNCDLCSDGYYMSGTQCVACSPGCEDQCDKASGTCTCKAGSTGSRCDICADGWYMSEGNCYQCQSSCATCTSSAYTCTSCFTGYFSNGNTCTPCRTGCTQCSSDTNCHKCATGHHSPSIGCPACSTGCEGRCDQTSGSCTCRPGFDGEKCDRCSPNVQSNPNCDQCVPGYHGESCDQNCPENCNQTVCGRYDGKCAYGCVGEFFGSNCNKIEACATGHYGEECSLTCPKSCRRGCDRRTGTCINVCHEDECRSCSTDIAISAGVAVVICGIIGLICALLYKRRQIARRPVLNEHSDNRRNPVYQNDEVTPATEEMGSYVNDGVVQEEEISDTVASNYKSLEKHVDDDQPYAVIANQI